LDNKFDSNSGYSTTFPFVVVVRSLDFHQVDPGSNPIDSISFFILNLTHQSITDVLIYAKIGTPCLGSMYNLGFWPLKKLLLDRVYQLNSNPYGPTLYSRALFFPYLKMYVLHLSI
jgi:hypothetical protein